MTTKRKLSIPSDRAAYAATQALFDALRQGCAGGEDFISCMITTRDATQRLHAEHDKGSMTMLTEHFLSAWLDFHKLQHNVLEEFANAIQSWPLSAQASQRRFEMLGDMQTWSEHFGKALDRATSEAAQADKDGFEMRTAPELHASMYPDGAEAQNAKRRKMGPHSGDDIASSGINDSNARENRQGMNNAQSSSDHRQRGSQGYKDVTAEVEARLEARVKEALAAEKEKRREKKERKRKRESAASMESVANGTAHLGIDEEQEDDEPVMDEEVGEPEGAQDFASHGSKKRKNGKTKLAEEETQLKVDKPPRKKHKKNKGSATEEASAGSGHPTANDTAETGHGSSKARSKDKDEGRKRSNDGTERDDANGEEHERARKKRKR